MKKILLILLALAAWSVGALAQPRTVTGKVLSGEDGTPLIQAAVIVKGTQIGVATDLDGRYSIRVPNNDAVLIFSYAGMESTEVRVGNQSVIDVTLQPESVDVDEVMVVAFGKTKKSAFTGSATEVTSKELEKKQVSNVVSALQSKVAGVTVSNGDNQPGTSPSINVRGVGSFSSNGSPLIVVDGVPYAGNLSMINPQDIESTVLLKDAASAALYGSRGANGVLLITTKSGKASKSGDCIGMNVSASVRIGANFKGIPDYDLITDPREYIALTYEAQLNPRVRAYSSRLPMDVIRNRTFINQILKPGDYSINYVPFTVEGAMDPATATWDQWFNYDESTGRYSLTDNATLGRMIQDVQSGEKFWLQPDDWYAALFHPGLRQEYNVSVSGRGEKLSHYFSSSYLNERGYLIGSSFQRYTARLRADYRVNRWLNTGANLNYSYSRLKNQNTTGSQVANPMQIAYRLAPIYPIYVRGEDKEILLDAYGNPLGDYGTGKLGGLGRQVLPFGNPVIDNIVNRKESVLSVVNARTYADFILPYDFKITVNAAYDFSLEDFHSMHSLLQGEAVTKKGSVYRAMEYFGVFNTQQLLNWGHDFGKHHVDALLGHEFYYYHRQKIDGAKTKMFGPYRTQLSSAYGEPSTSSEAAYKAVEGYLTRVNYDYAERYFLSASYRRDGTSKFAKDKRWGNFFSVGLSWLISRESFMKSTSSWLSMLKLKASYGMQGNDRVNTTYYDIYNITNIGDGLGTVYGKTGNPLLTWETSHNLNVGFESAFFNNRLNVSLDVFYKYITDMIFRRPLPPSSGKSFIYQNIGDMRNLGTEIVVSGVLYKDENVRWTASMNGAHINNKITKLPPEYTKSKDGGRLSGLNFYKEGAPIHNLLLVHYTGVDSTGASTWQAYNKKGELSTTTNYSVAASEIRNKKYYTNVDPKFFGGFSTEVDFFGFDFSMSFGYQIGGLDIDGMYQDLMNGGHDLGSAMHADTRNAWTPQKKTNIPALDAIKSTSNATSDRFLISTSYLSIDNITLGYTLPQKWLSAIKLTSARVYLVCDNVWLFSARKGYDPRHTEYFGVKAMRTVSGGISVTF